MEYGTITAETSKLIGGLNAVVYVNAGGSIVVEIPFESFAYPPELCAKIRKTLGDKDELFPEQKQQITDEGFKAIRADIRERAKKHEPVNFDLVANSIDGSHTHQVRIAPGTDCLLCNCGSPLFVVMFAEFSDYSGGIIAQCQECGQIIEVQKD